MVLAGLIDAQNKVIFIVKIMAEKNRRVPIFLNLMKINLSSATKNCNLSIDNYGASLSY